MTNDTALVTVAVVDSDIVPSFAMTLGQAKARIEELQQFVRSQMVEGEDYGRIPNTPKPTLFKPGAEKLCDIYALSPAVETLRDKEDWDAGFFYYLCRVRLISRRTGSTIAEGVGSCNSKENRYKNQNPFNLANMILKMAKKRALVDAVLSATRSSGLFTQDIEDIVDEPPAPAPKRPPQPVVAPALAVAKNRLEQLRGRWSVLWAEATMELGIPVKDLPTVKETASEQELVEAGKKLAGIIQQHRDLLVEAAGGEEAE